ncbi:MAG: HAMP domain-containing sensor histidine kinase [Planctomycetota bacterium]
MRRATTALAAAGALGLAALAGFGSSEGTGTGRLDSLALWWIGISASIAAVAMTVQVSRSTNRAKAERDFDRMLGRWIGAGQPMDRQQLRARAEDLIGAGRRAPDQIASIVHDLRTPMTIVLSSTELLECGYASTDEERSEMLEQITAASQHALFLVNDLLDLAALRSDGLHIDLRPCLGADLLKDAARVLDSLARARGKELVVETTDERIGFHADPRRVLQILFNLVSNAVKYSPEGARVWLRVSRENQGTGELLDGAAVIFEVEDEGFGVPAEGRERLFEPYERSHDGRTVTVESTGLGLPLCRELASRMNGRVGYRPRVGKEGSVFWVRLPIDARRRAASTI